MFIGASAHLMAAFSGFYKSPGPPLSGDMHSIVPSHCHGHQNGKQSGHILHRCFVCCHPGGRQGDMGQVDALWQRLVAFMKALDLFHCHWAMRAILHRHNAMAIEMANTGGTFVHCRRLFRLIKT